MKIGDVITCCTQNDAIVTGEVVGVAAMTSRTGWYVSIVPTNQGEPRDQWTSYTLRHEDEGATWIYGDDATAKRALEVARALADRTVVSPRDRLVHRYKTTGRKKGPL